jgi:DNA-binding MarR family transcriptional regulator
MFAICLRLDDLFQGGHRGLPGVDLTEAGVAAELRYRCRVVPHLTEDELLAWRGMLELEARLLTVLDAELREKRGLSVSEFDALYQLWIRPGGRCRMKDIANRLLVSRGGATKLINRLEKRGLVRRISQSGLQAVSAELTEAGESVLVDAMDTHFDGVRRLVISRLEPDELAMLRRIAERIRDNPQLPSSLLKDLSLLANLGTW